jgi:hypothetical protein
MLWGWPNRVLKNMQLAQNEVQHDVASKFISSFCFVSNHYRII